MSLVGWAWGQQAASNPSTVPTVIRFSGNLADVNGKPLSGVVGVTFSLYAGQQGGAALWVETQNVQADKSGHYAVTLGSTTTQGLPQGIFASGEARWLGVQPQGQAERPRVLLMSVPYALKAADADTVGGLSPSAFVLAAPSPRGSTVVTAGSPPTGGSGTMNYIPIWTDNTGDLGNSVLYQTSGGMVGIGTTTPAATLDVSSGDVSIDSGNLDLPLTVLDKSNVGVVTVGGTPFVHTCCSPKNTFVGSNAGTNAGTFSIDGANNTGIGNQALNAIRNGDSNTAVGSLAMQFQNDGGSNTAIGASALELATATSYNTAIGENSLTQTTTGSSNTALGTSTGNGNLTGTNNTFLGMGADTTVSNLTFATAIGSNARVSESNALVLGGTGSNAVKVGIGTAAPAYTLDVQGTGNFTGAVTFASSQSFPNTISGVTTAAGSGLMGGGTSGTLNLSLLNTCSSGQVLSWSGSAWVCTTSGGGTITGVTAGTDLTGGGTSGNVTLNVDTTKVPQLNTGNTFTGNQTVNGNLSATGVVIGTGFQIGSNLFAFGSYAKRNAFLGFAGNSTMTGTANTASGYQALNSNTTGRNNTASGYQALTSNTTGGNNTASGYLALTSNTTGGTNTAYGGFALALNTKGGDNTASGYAALLDNTSGKYNTAIGVNALTSNSAGYYNTASGALALNSNTIGGYDTASGYRALTSNTTGEYNTASGNNALSNNTTGNFNTAVGFGAGPDSGSPNLTNATAIGADATVSESNALVLGGTGSYAVNVGIGTAAPTYLLHIAYTGGFNNNFLRVEGPTAAGTGGNLASFGGYGDFGIDSFGIPEGRFYVRENGNVGIGCGLSNSSGCPDVAILSIGEGLGSAAADGWFSYSSRRWKKNIHTLHGALAKVEQLRGVSYDRKDSGKHEVGVIAEEVGKVVPEVVSWEKNGKDAQGVDYSRLTALLIEATKEQQALLRDQQKQIKTQQSQIQAEQRQIKAQAAQIRAQQAAAKVQQAQIAGLGAKVKTIQIALRDSGRTDSGVLTAKANTLQAVR